MSIGFEEWSFKSKLTIDECHTFDILSLSLSNLTVKVEMERFTASMYRALDV